MATEGKIPMLGFKAAAAKFATLFGFSPAPVAASTRYISLAGRWEDTVSLTGRWETTVALVGRWEPTISLSGRWE